MRFSHMASDALEVADMTSARAESAACWICGDRVSLEDCKIDEQGRAVHEKCYIERLGEDPSSRGAGQRKESSPS